MNVYNPKDIVTQFIEAINDHDVKKIEAMMTEDHRFMDSYGVEIIGKVEMIPEWLRFLKITPDYNIDVEDMISEGNKVMVVGQISGTITKDGNMYPENQYRCLAAWYGVVEGDKIKEWRLISNLSVIVELINRLEINWEEL